MPKPSWAHAVQKTLFWGDASGSLLAHPIEELNDGSNEFLWWTTGLAPSDGYLFDSGAPIAFPPSPLHKL